MERWKQTETSHKVSLCHELAEIAGSSKLNFYLSFRTSFVYSFQQNFWKGRKNTEYHCLIKNMLEAAEYLDQESIVMVSTIEFAETQDMKAVFEKMEKKGCRIWLMDNAESHYVSYADQHFLKVRMKPPAWIVAFECLLLFLSERYRGKYID